MAQHNCENCSFRAKYDNKPDSFLGKIWRWHINWCPGWKRYLKSLPEEKRSSLENQYQLKK